MVEFQKSVASASYCLRRPPSTFAHKSATNTRFYSKPRTFLCDLHKYATYLIENIQTLANPISPYAIFVSRYSTKILGLRPHAHSHEGAHALPENRLRCEGGGPHDWRVPKLPPPVCFLPSQLLAPTEGRNHRKPGDGHCT